MSKKNKKNKMKRLLKKSKKVKFFKKKRLNRRQKRRAKFGSTKKFAPLASGNTIRIDNPLRTTSLVHSEYVCDVTYSGDGIAKTLFINPGNVGSFPWLSGMAQLFETYAFRGLKAYFIPLVSASVDGSVALCPDYDPDDVNTNLSKAQILQFEDTVRGSVWNDTVMTCTKRNLNKGCKLYVRHGSEETDEKKLYDTCQLHVFLSGLPTEYVDSVVGEIWIGYDITLETPQIGSSNIVEGKVQVEASVGKSDSSAPFCNNSQRVIDQFLHKINVSDANTLITSLADLKAKIMHTYNVFGKKNETVDLLSKRFYIYMDGFFVDASKSVVDFESLVFEAKDEKGAITMLDPHLLTECVTGEDTGYDHYRVRYLVHAPESAHSLSISFEGLTISEVAFWSGVEVLIEEIKPEIDPLPDNRYGKDKKKLKVVKTKPKIFEKKKFRAVKKPKTIEQKFNEYMLQVQKQLKHLDDKLTTKKEIKEKVNEKFAGSEI